ncbi:hypothetical protein GQX73_g5353 [Xylaria multiplex]|uniref:Uncharacterized protein n=1 Tax=Xylaria multiplex TaxID=323545 RepID=A0A7C8J0X8_9PEZI|nr:hypothetical protein GQX73_g5353 [Xylaria multiplex]
METVVACCGQCDHHLGTLLNLWTQIGECYISPVVAAKVALDVGSDGAVHQGKKGTIIYNWGQLLLRTSSIQIKHLDGQVDIKPIVQRILNLKNNPPVDDSEDDKLGSAFFRDCNLRQATTNENPELSHILSTINAQGETLERLDTAGYQIVASFNRAVQRIDDEVGNLKNEMIQVTGDLSVSNTKSRSLFDDILSTRTDIEGIKRVLQPMVAQGRTEEQALSVRNAITKANTSLRLEFSQTWEKFQERLNLLESELQDMRQDLKGFQILLEGAQATAKATLPTSDANTQEIMALKNELENLKRDLALDQSYRSSSTNPVFASRELDILTSNITKIGYRASQVETLQMEFELLKDRVQRMEAQLPNWQEPQNPRSMDPKQMVSLKFLSEGGNNPRIPPSTTPNLRDDYVNRSNSPPLEKAHINTARAGILKLTKSGAIDKRTIRKSGWKRAGTVRKVGG